MNKVLVKIFFPRIDTLYEVWLPLNQSINNIIIQLLKGVNELNGDIYNTNELPILYNKSTGKYYELDSLVCNTNIVNGTELIFI